MEQLPEVLSGEVVGLVEMPALYEMLAFSHTASSIAIYQRDVQAYHTFALEHGFLWLDPESLMIWRDTLVRESRMSPHTINRMLSAVRCVIREMADRRIIDEKVSIRFDRVRGAKVKPLKGRLKHHAQTKIEPEEMRAICDAPDKSTLTGLRDAALLATLASSGVRAEEAATLMISQVKRRDGGYLLNVRGKTDTEYREAPLSPEAYNLISLWLELRLVECSYIFTAFTTRGAKPLPKHISTVTVWNIITRYARMCGYPHVKPHDFRRFVGTQIARDDIRMAQKALGHKSIETTVKHYVLDELRVGLTDNLY